MKPGRVVFHGFVLFAANLAGLLVGCIRCYAIGSRDDLEALPIAALFTVLLFLAWVLLIRNLPLKNLPLQGRLEYLFAGGCSLLWSVLVFAPLHINTRGFLFDRGEMLSLLLFQVYTNAAALFLAWKVTQRKSREPV